MSGEGWAQAVTVPRADLLLVMEDAGSNPYQEHYAALGRIEALIAPARSSSPAGDTP